MTDHDERVVPASLAIPASADIVFAALADPSRHPLWDGNDNLKFSSTGQRVQRVGDIFSTTLTGGSVRENHVVEFVESQVIAWMPAEPGQMPVGHVWRFTLAPIDPNATLTTHVYDWTNMFDESRYTRARATTKDRLMASLMRLSEHVQENQ